MVWSPSTATPSAQEVAMSRKKALALGSAQQTSPLQRSRIPATMSSTFCTCSIQAAAPPQIILHTQHQQTSQLRLHPTWETIHKSTAPTLIQEIVLHTQDQQTSKLRPHPTWETVYNPIELHMMVPF